MKNDAVECEKCDGELEIGFVWDRCLKCGHLQNRDFETYRHKCDRCRCYLTDDNRVNDLCKACDEYLEQSQAKQNDAVNHPSHYTSHPSGVECIQVTEHLNFCIGNAIKKLLCAGQRGVKDQVKDIHEAKDTLERCLELLSVGGDNA